MLTVGISGLGIFVMFILLAMVVISKKPDPVPEPDDLEYWLNYQPTLDDEIDMILHTIKENLANLETMIAQKRMGTRCNQEVTVLTPQELEELPF